MEELTYEGYRRPAAARECLESALATAEKWVLLMTNVRDLPALLPSVRAVHDRGALVMVLVTGPTRPTSGSTTTPSPTPPKSSDSGTARRSR